MTSKEALEKIIFDYNFKEKIESGYIYSTEIPFMAAIANIMGDLDKLDKVYDKVEELLQDELTSLLREIPYDMLNSIKVRILSKLKEWLDNDK